MAFRRRSSCSLRSSGSEAAPSRQQHHGRVVEHQANVAGAVHVVDVAIAQRLAQSRADPRCHDEDAVVLGTGFVVVERQRAVLVGHHDQPPRRAVGGAEVDGGRPPTALRRQRPHLPTRRQQAQQPAFERDGQVVVHWTAHGTVDSVGTGSEGRSSWRRRSMRRCAAPKVTPARMAAIDGRSDDPDLGLVLEGRVGCARRRDEQGDGEADPRRHRDGDICRLVTPLGSTRDARLGRQPRRREHADRLADDQTEEHAEGDPRRPRLAERPTRSGPPRRWPARRSG